MKNVAFIELRDVYMGETDTVKTEKFDCKVCFPWTLLCRANNLHADSVCLFVGFCWFCLCLLYRMHT